MKKFLKFLIILIIIAIIGFCAYKFIFEKKNNSNNTEDFSKLEQYVSDIYGRTFLIPEFDDINNADEEWLWENVNQYVWNHDDEYHEKNNEQYGYTYEDVSKIVKILYGDNLKKSFPKGAISMRYSPYHDTYGPTSFDVPFYYNYQIDKISKSENTYTVSLYDYVISNYFAQGPNPSEDRAFTIFNNYDYILNGDENSNPIISVASLKDKKFENILDQKDKLSHKILTIKYDEPSNLYYIVSCKYEDLSPENILAQEYYEIQQSFEISNIEYNRDDIYTQDEVLVNNFDELTKIYTENCIDTYKKEMGLLVFKDNGEVYITAGDITIGDFIKRIDFKDIEQSENKITATVVRTFRESWDYTDELYDKTYQKEDKLTIIKKDGMWYVDEFNYNNN